jgi:hypothetical protein
MMEEERTGTEGDEWALWSQLPHTRSLPQARNRNFWPTALDSERFPRCGERTWPV